jgi:hypothetical protein
LSLALSVSTVPTLKLADAVCPDTTLSPPGWS